MSEDRPRVLVITPFIFLPTTFGGAVRTSQICSAIKEFADLYFFAFTDKNEISQQKFLCLTKGIANEVIIEKIPSSPFIRGFYRRRSLHRLEEFINRIKPSVIIITLSFMYDEIFERLKIPIVIDEMNIEFMERYQRSKSATNILTKIRQYLAYKKLRRIAMNCYNNSNMIWVTSNVDREIIRSRARNTPVDVIPIAAPDVTKDEDIAIEPYSIGIVTSFGHPPNQLALKFILEKLYPLLKSKEPRARLHIIGQDPPEWVLEHQKRETNNIVVTGFVDDIQGYLKRLSVNIVPIFSGTGIRVKLLEALATGRPIVTTRKGAEGIDVEDNVHLLFAETSQEFCEKIQQLWASQELGERISNRALELVRDKYSIAVVRSAIRKSIERFL